MRLTALVWASLALRLTLQIKAATPTRDNPLRTPGPFEREYIYHRTHFLWGPVLRRPMYQAHLAVSSHASVGGGNMKATVQSRAFADQHLTTEADVHESNIDSVAPLSGRLIGEFRGVFLLQLQFPLE
ncbi:hypothetical protein BC826DRAFT_998612 [Russula brevipes]|nr:hypothetical protein BC826DRAFT_998612 [Russula brevipes]